MKRYKEAILYLVFILVVFVYSMSKIYPEIVNIINIEKSIKEKSVLVIDQGKKLETLKATELEKMNVAGQAKKIYKPETSGLDAESSFAVVFDDIIDMAKYNGVKVYSIEYVYNPPEDEVVKGAGGKYNVCQLSMDLVADYPDLESFLKEIYKYPYLANIAKIEMAPYSKNKKLLLTSLQIKLYAST